MQAAQIDPPPTSLKVSQLIWFAAAAVFLGLAGFVALRISDVRTALEAGLVADESASGSPSDAADISDAVKFTLAGSAGVGLLLVLGELISLYYLFGRRPGAYTALIGLGLANLAATAVYWSLLSEASDATNSTLTWGPPVLAGLIVVALAFALTPSARRWFKTGEG